MPGIKKVLIASGLRYDLAVRSPEYIKELVTPPRRRLPQDRARAHRGRPAVEDDEAGHRQLRPVQAACSTPRRKAAGKEQYLIPYFIAAHPGTTDEDMLDLALWLKRNGFRPDQVQTFLPTPLALATAMYHTGKNPLKRVSARSRRRSTVVRGGRQRRLHKAFLRYHDPENWPLLREALKADGPRRPDRQRQAPPGAGLAAGGHQGG